MLENNKINWPTEMQKELIAGRNLVRNFKSICRIIPQKNFGITFHYLQLLNAYSKEIYYKQNFKNNNKDFAERILERIAVAISKRKRIKKKKQ